jgi:hypothetical protein
MVESLTILYVIGQVTAALSATYGKNSTRVVHVLSLSRLHDKHGFCEQKQKLVSFVSSPLFKSAAIKSKRKSRRISNLISLSLSYLPRTRISILIFS